MLITAAMIVRNEEGFLDGCLESLTGLVDEVVVVDTGSEDRSREIAARHGARVTEMEWSDDFAAARNRALDLARGEWILYIDADERVRTESARGVRSRLRNPALLGEHVWLRPRKNHTAYRVLRLFRNHRDIRFEGVIHETIWPSLLQYRALAGGEFGSGDLALDHFGYEDDLARKHRRNLPLLQRAIADPLRFYAWSHLAETYLALGQENQAVETWERAIVNVREKGAGLPDGALPFIGLLQFKQGRGDDTVKLLAEARELFPHDIQLIRLEGDSCMKAQQYARAISCFERLLQFRGVESMELPTAYDRNLFELYSCTALADCYFRLKNYLSSAYYYRLAAECNPDSRELRVKEALCARLDRQSLVGAL